MVIVPNKARWTKSRMSPTPSVTATVKKTRKTIDIGNGSPVLGVWKHLIEMMKRTHYIAVSWLPTEVYPRYYNSYSNVILKQEINSPLIHTKKSNELSSVNKI